MLTSGLVPTDGSSVTALNKLSLVLSWLDHWDSIDSSNTVDHIPVSFSELNASLELLDPRQRPPYPQEEAKGQ